MDDVKTANRAGLTGIAINAFLCVFKLLAGYMSNSISVISDGYNNLSDVGNALFIYLGYRLAGKPADKDHPYGHGRFEYMISQAISIMIVIVGLNLLKTSIERFISPKPMTYNGYVLPVLTVSIAIKLGLAVYYDRLYRQTKMEALKAQKIDSLSDLSGTVIIVIAYLIMPHTDIPLDAIIGVLLSLFIIASGSRIFIRMTSILIGQPAPQELYDQIEGIIRSFSYVRDCHSINLHSYGMHQVFGSCEVQMDGKLSFIDTHAKIEAIELSILEKTGVTFTIHADPLDSSKEVTGYEKKLKEVLDGLDEKISYHHFHYNSELKSYLVDIVLPYDSRYKEDYIEDIVRKKLNDAKLKIRISRE